MEKIKVLITHDNADIKEEIKNNIEDLDYVEVVGCASNGCETLDSILKYKPNIVFIKFAITDIPVYDLMVKTENVLHDEAPIFKYISNDLSKNISITSYKGIEKGTSASVKEFGINGILTTLNDYNDVFLGQ